MQHKRRLCPNPLIQRLQMGGQHPKNCLNLTRINNTVIIKLVVIYVASRRIQPPARNLIIKMMHNSIQLMHRGGSDKPHWAHRKTLLVQAISS
jgi:hypothetical protein